MWPHTGAPQRASLLKSCHPSALSVAARRHPSVSPSLDGAWGSDRERDSTFAPFSPHGQLTLQTSEHVRCRGESGTLTRRSRLIWLFHLLTPCRLVRLLWHSNWQSAARTRARRHVATLPRSRRPARVLAAERKSHKWLQEFLGLGTNPLKHFNYIWQSPVRWQRAPAHMGWNANEDILARGRSTLWIPQAEKHVWISMVQLL